MPKMTKSNAREILANTFKRFRLITGEGIGAVFTWHGKLATIGPRKFCIRFLWDFQLMWNIQSYRE